MRILISRGAQFLQWWTTLAGLQPPASVASRRCLSRRALPVERALGRKPLEVDFRVVGETHRGRNRGMTCLLGDQPVHPLADRRYAGCPCGEVLSSMTCIVSRAFIRM